MINRGEAGAGMLKVKHLLAELTDIKKPADMKETNNRHYERDIIAPLERSLDELMRVEALLSWGYCRGKDEPLTADQARELPFSEWLELYIQYVPNLPDQTPYIEGHRKKLEAAKKRKASTTKKRNVKKSSNFEGK